MSTPEELRIQINAKKAEVRALELELTRSTVMQQQGDQLEWLSTASNHMVSLSDGMTGGYEVTVFDYTSPQATGTLSEEDIVSLRDFLTVHTMERLNMKETE